VLNTTKLAKVSDDADIDGFVHDGAVRAMQHGDASFFSLIFIAFKLTLGFELKHKQIAKPEVQSILPLK